TGPWPPMHWPKVPLPPGGHTRVPGWHCPTFGKSVHSSAKPSTVPSQSLSLPSQISGVGPLPVQLIQLPAEQVSMPGLDSPTLEPHARVRSSSILPSQSSSRLLQSSTVPQVVHAPSSMAPSQSSSRLLQISLVGVPPGLVIWQTTPVPCGSHTKL